MTSFLRRLARSYHQLCAAEDVRRRGLRVPDGIWVCTRCRHVSLDAFSSSRHLLVAHG